MDPDGLPESSYTDKALEQVWMKSMKKFDTYTCS